MRCRALTIFAFLSLLILDVTSAHAATLDRVKEAGAIRIGYRVDARPHSFADASGQPAGYIVDVCREVVGAVRQALNAPNLRIDYVAVTAADRFEAVRKGQVDLLCEASSITMARREIVDFSLPTFVDGAGVIAKQDAPVRSFQNLARKRIGVLAGTTTERVLQDSLTALNVKADVQKVTDHRRGAALVGSGELDAYMADRSILTMMVVGREVPTGLAISPRYFSYETYGLALERGDTAFRLLVDRTVARLSRSGRLEELIRKAMGADPDELQRMLIAINAVPN